MMDLSKSFLTPFDPWNIAHEDGVFGFLHVGLSAPKKWHLVHVMPDTDADGNDEPTIRFLELRKLSNASAYELCPWIPLQWPDPEIPDQYLPAYRLTLDGPGGERITREWGPGPMSKRGREIINRMIELATGGADQ